MKLEGLIFDFGFTLFQFKDVSVEKYLDCYRKGLNRSIIKLKEMKLLKNDFDTKQFIKIFNEKRASYFKKSIQTKMEYPTSFLFKEVFKVLDLDQLSEKSYSELANLYHSCEEEEWIPFEHTKETLKHLSDLKKVKIALLSNHPNHTTIQNLLIKHDLSKFFDAVVTSAEFGKRKPDPEIFFYTIKKMGLKNPASCLICGDEYADIVGGHKAGLQTILCKRSYKFPFEKEIDFSGYIKINNISEIIKLII
ncbi:MAG: HAD family hydrolase [Candidatus Thorarchaeota archaeon]